MAGPGFCAGRARPDPSSTKVGALAADTDGTLWFESGDPREGLLTKVVSTASVPVVRTGIASIGRGDGTDHSTGGGAASASLLAPSRTGGLLIALPTVVVEYATDFRAVAGARRGDGDPPAPQSGDRGHLSDATFRNIAAIASDNAGNVYVADEIDDDGGEMAIRFLNRSNEMITFYEGTADEVAVAPGTLDTIAGRRGRPTATLVAEAPGLAVAGDRLYLSSAGRGAQGRATVRLLNLGGTKLAINGVTLAPGATATVATVAAGEVDGGSRPVPVIGGIAADEDGNLFFAEPANHRVRRLNGPGAITTFAGTGAAGFNGNDRRATEARLDRPYDVEIGAGGRLYISDAGNDLVRVIDPDGIVRAAMGNGTTNRWICSDEDQDVPTRESSGHRSHTGRPTSIAADAAGNVYVANGGWAQLHRVALSGSVDLVAGASPCAEPQGCVDSRDDAAPKMTRFGPLVGLKMRSSGGLYVIEETRVRLFNPASEPVDAHGVSVPGGAMRIIAGEPPPKDVAPDASAASTIPTVPTAPPPSTPDGEPAVADSPGVAYTGLTEDGRGNLVLGDIPLGGYYAGNGSVRLIDRRGIITTLIDRPGLGPDGTADPSRCCAYPSGLVTDHGGNLYIADTTARRVWFFNRSARPVVSHGVSVSAGEIKAVAGAGSTGSQDEGVRALEARLLSPRGLALDEIGNLYIADTFAHSVRRVSVDGTITTVAGNGQPGFNGDGLKAGLAAFNQPTDVAFDGCGNLLIADSGNDRVRRLNLVTSCRGAPQPESESGSGSGRYFAAATGLCAIVVGAIVFFGRARRRRDRGTSTS